MNKEITQITRTENLEAASLIRLFELDLHFFRLHQTCVVNKWDYQANVNQEYLLTINKEIKSRF